MDNLLGGNTEELNALQTIVRAVIIFITAMVCIRISGMRAFGKMSAIDVVISIIIGSVLARTIAGNVPFFPSIAAAIALSVVHWLLAYAAMRSDRISNFLKGRERLLIKDGKMIRENMQRFNITEGDLMEGIRLSGHVSSLDEIKEAYFERSGQISAIPKVKEV